jgi:methylmalonyl-CoA mutase
MSELPENPSFAADFPQATHQQWLKLVESALKGASFDQKLVARSYDGLRIEPLYGPAACRAPPGR